MKKKVFVSSTSEDLREYRRAVADELRQMGYEPIIMEDFPTTGRNPFTVCYGRIAESDIFIGIYGYRYGWKPRKGFQFDTSDGKIISDGEKSIVRWEYEWAKYDLKIGDMKLFLADDGNPPPDLLRWSRRESAETQLLLDEFRHKLEDENTVKYYSSKSDLLAKLREDFVQSNLPVNTQPTSWTRYGIVGTLAIVVSLLLFAFVVPSPNSPALTAMPPSDTTPAREISATPSFADELVTLDNLNTWRKSQDANLPTLVENPVLQRLASNQLAYLSNLTRSELLALENIAYKYTPNKQRLADEARAEGYPFDVWDDIVIMDTEVFFDGTIGALETELNNRGLRRTFFSEDYTAIGIASYFEPGMKFHFLIVLLGKNR
jgi:hypothetical protein